MTQDEFLSNVQPWNNHLPLLWLALQETSGDVAEFGSGDGSTPYLREYCQKSERNFFTYDNDPEWCEKTGSILTDWSDPLIYRPYDVCLIDHAPGEHRHQAIAILKDMAKIIVVHDSEPEATGYMLDKIWPLFKFRVDIKTDGAWATALSNSIWIHKWNNMDIAGYKVI